MKKNNSEKIKKKVFKKNHKFAILEEFLSYFVPFFFIWIKINERIWNKMMVFKQQEQSSTSPR